MLRPQMDHIGPEEIISWSCCVCHYRLDVLRSLGYECRESSIDRYVYTFQASADSAKRVDLIDIFSGCARSTVVRTLLFNLRTSPLVTEMLGEGVRPKPFLFGGEPWVHGTVSNENTVISSLHVIQS